MTRKQLARIWTQETVAPALLEVKIPIAEIETPTLLYRTAWRVGYMAGVRQCAEDLLVCRDGVAGTLEHDDEG